MAGLRSGPSEKRLVAEQGRGKFGHLKPCNTIPCMDVLSVQSTDIQAFDLILSSQDLSDDQWRSFRGNLVPLSLVFAAFAGTSALCRRLGWSARRTVTLALSLCFIGASMKELSVNLVPNVIRKLTTCCPFCCSIFASYCCSLRCFAFVNELQAC